MNKRFQRRIEDFACGHCGMHVVGDGYTNHCPHCLWSRHVDVNPGDRAAECGGAMRPVAVEPARGGWTLTHACETCGTERRCKSAAVDDRDALLAVARAAAQARIR
ncbi:MAG: RNHCP domain-containing protein [Rhodospirillales bacterium]|jgi:hypothetical protein